MNAAADDAAEKAAQEGPEKAAADQKEAGTTPSDRWRKFRNLSTGVSIVLVPIVIAVIGNAISVTLKDKDIRLWTVALAVAMLQEDPKTNPESEAPWKWAMDVIDAYSGVPVSKEARE